jgi:hypothetical protein
VMGVSDGRSASCAATGGRQRARAQNLVERWSRPTSAASSPRGPAARAAASPPQGQIANSEGRFGRGRRLRAEPHRPRPQECDGNVSAASRISASHTPPSNKIQRHGIRELALTARGGVPQRPRVD